MKIFLKQIFALICAGYFFVALSGYNIVRYCCAGCANAGIEVVAGKSCHTIHHEKIDFEKSCCTKLSANQCEEMNVDCEILRVQTDVSLLEITTTSNYHNSNLSVEFSNTVFNYQNKYNFSTEQSAHYQPNKKVLLHSGRDILARNAVLLI
jgi:hypothetical protein